MNISELFWDNPFLFMFGIIILISFGVPAIQRLVRLFVERNMTDEEKKESRERAVQRARSYEQMERSFQAEAMRKKAIKNMEEEFDRADKHERDL